MVPIGIGADAPVVPGLGLIDAAVLDQVPRRGRESTKFAAGAVLVCGGSLGLTGAPCLASESAQRAGAGYVTALIPASLNLVFEQRLLEAMSVPLPDEDGALQPGGLDEILTRCERAGALTLGPGIGRAEPTQELVRAVAGRAPIPLLLDADGLFAYSGRLPELASRDAATVLTPHAGELGRLLERESVGDRSAPAERGAGGGVGGAGDRRAQGRRHDRLRARRPRGDQSRRRRGARHRRHRRRAVGRDRRLPVQADGTVHGRLRRSVRPRPRGTARRRRDRRRGRDRQRRDRAAAARPAAATRRTAVRGTRADGAGAGTRQPRARSSETLRD